MSAVGLQPVTAQPMAGGGQVMYVSPGGVTVRTMTEADSDFAGSLQVSGFQEKFVQNVGIRNLGTVTKASVEDHKQSSYLYHRIFIAEFQGERAGLMELHFNGDRRMAISDDWKRLDCRAMCRLFCLFLCWDEKVKRDRCYLDHICVDDKFRGKGVGQAMLVVADQQARAEGCHTIYLWVATDNRAQNLYSREGYQKTATTTACCMANCTTGHKKFYKMEKRL